MEIDVTYHKYGKYCRKSSDEKDKQSQSIETQTRELGKVVENANLFVVPSAAWEEERSAFVTGRPLFAELVRATEQGVIDAWLVWHPTRLARNPTDAGTVIRLMDEGHLHHVRTPSRVYTNNSTDKLLLAFELIISKKDSDDKSKWIRENIETKASKGVPHGLAKIGFVNSKNHAKGDGYWFVDEERFPKVERLFALFLEGTRSVGQIHSIAKDELRLRTPVRKQSGGRPIPRTYLYKMLGDPIYAGFFYYGGKRYELDPRLPRALREAQYWRVQEMLGRRGRPRKAKRQAVYAPFMRDAAGGGVTPDFKFQLICSQCRHKFSHLNRERCPKCGTGTASMKNPRYLSYTYYYGTRAKKLSQARAQGIEEKRLEAWLMQYFDTSLVISTELAQWCIDYLTEALAREECDRRVSAQALEDAERTIATTLERLLDLRISKTHLSPEELALFERKERQLRAELAEVREKNKCQNHEDQWLADAREEFLLYAKLTDIIQNGTVENKRDALRRLGSNLTLSGGKVRISNAKSVQTFIEYLKWAKRRNGKFEPKNTVDTTDRNDTFRTVRPILRRGLDTVRTCLVEKIRAKRR